ncbi:SNF2-related protein [Paucibacter sp. KBW04]|uniref:SNF2-related protein n=1 Tax=Paucibacter sp. KBW04 TaxID=2153361 RepID=UPI001E2CDAEC|nr:SNF2-related protein [Paucibacter sp. KBW04]
MQAQTAGAVLGEYRVSEIDEAGASWRVQVLGAQAIDCRCNCAAFPLSDRGSCEHIAFALAQLLSQPSAAEALRRGPQFDYSEVLLRFGARRQLRWRQGHGCPSVVAEAAQALTDESGRLRAEAPGALAHLLQVAAAAGHELRVEEGVWPLLAHKRDAGQRVLRLEQNYPQGLETPALRNLLKLPLPMFQLEAALFAVSAGRSLLADDLGLGLYAQALGASELFMRHFGVERVLLLCAESAQSRWLAEAQTLSGRAAQMVWGDAQARAEQLADGQAQIKICASSALAQDLSQLQSFAPELIIVDEAGRLDAQALAALKVLEAARPEQGFLLLLSGQILSGQPKVLLPLVELLDQQRSGPYARFLSYHARRDAAGQIQGFVGLDALDQTLERLMFSRSKAELSPVLPPALVQLRSVSLSQTQQTLQARALADLRRGVQRWERSDYVSDAEQLALARAVQSLRRLAISPQLMAAASDAPGDAAGEVQADAPKLAAVAAVSRELLGSAVQRLVVFCQWDDALSLLAARLQSQGFKFMQLSANQGLAERQALARRWREDERVQLLLISDAAAAGLQLINEGSEANLGLINLELPWSEELLGRRLSALCEESTRGLPLIQLQAQQGLEQAMLQAMDVLPELPKSCLDGDASLQLLQGEDLSAWMRALALLCSLLPK